MADTTRPITISINALGGQGGGVLANWIIALAEAEGYIAQGTSVPGVAQRTGATIYCLELFPKSALKGGKKPVLSLMPVPGDVDIVLASEWMEAGRAISRGFVTPDKTTLITSTHRDYAISEKSAPDDGRAKSDIIEDAAADHAQNTICFNMAACALEAECAISAVLFGALASSSALPFPRATYEDTIRSSGRNIDANLAGFSLGFQNGQDLNNGKEEKAARSPYFNSLMREFPHQVHDMLFAAVRRLADYQDQRYADEFIEHLRPVFKKDDRALGYALTREMATALGRWMSYEDIIRVADLKTRRARFNRIKEEARADKGQIVETIDYLHPRMEEIRDILPHGLGRLIEKTPFLQKFLSRLFNKGRHIKTNHISSFLLLRFIAGFRPWRRHSFRHHIEMTKGTQWRSLISQTSTTNYALAVEIAKAQAVIKGYGETYARTSNTYNLLLSQVEALKDKENGAQIFAELHAAALQDEDGAALNALLPLKG